VTGRRAAGPPRWYFSLRSPYSWLAMWDARQRHPQLLDEAEWIPFFEPDERSLADLTAAGGQFPYVPMSKAKHLYILSDVARLAAARGLRRPAWPVDREPVWEVPSLAALAALDRPGGREFVLRLAEARWQEGSDICDRRVVADLARECGLDPSIADSADDPVVRARGVETLQRVDRDGVFGVPFLIVGRESFWGLDRLDAAAEAYRRRRPADTPADEPPVPALVGRSADSGPAGGCG
jgi:2-hydroxychromene-2-carboxylate isomerase